jgi:hypothetical protein
MNDELREAIAVAWGVLRGCQDRIAGAKDAADALQRASGVPPAPPLPETERRFSALTDFESVP